MENIAQKNFMRSVSIYSYISGLPYFWFEELQWSPTLIHLRNYSTRAMTITCFIFIGMTWFLPIFTQTNWNTELIYKFILFNTLEPFLFPCIVWLWFYKNEVTELIEDLVVYAPTVYCDPGIQARMNKKAKTLVLLIVSFVGGSLSMVGLDAAIKAVKTDEVFITMISAWPDFEDKSQMAGVFRVFIYIAWFMLIFRVSGAITIMVSLMIYTCYQFIQLQNYFCNLANIFLESLSQSEKEKKYEESFKIGFKFHSDIIRITRKLVKTFNVIYGTKILADVVALSVIMFRMAHEERTLSNILSNAGVAATMLMVTGFYIWNLGDITIEADNLTSAMYMSGWENCYGTSSKRVRKLLLVAMAQTQNPLEIQAFGIVTVSYSLFVSIVKFSYSVFSVIV
nr:odorant receptor 34 [Achelura yunnanensis]